MDFGLDFRIMFYPDKRMGVTAAFSFFQSSSSTTPSKQNIWNKAGLVLEFV